MDRKRGRVVVSGLSNNMQEWNIYAVSNYGFPKKAEWLEVQVKSKSILGAAMKAAKIINKTHPGWVIERIWWLDPKRPRRDI